MRGEPSRIASTLLCGVLGGLGCWNATGTPLPLAAGLANISWQLPADVGVGARPFDWCLKDLRPLLAP